MIGELCGLCDWW